MKHQGTSSTLTQGKGESPLSVKEHLGKINKERNSLSNAVVCHEQIFYKFCFSEKNET